LGGVGRLFFFGGRAFVLRWVLRKSGGAFFGGTGLFYLLNFSKKIFSSNGEKMEKFFLKNSAGKE